MMPKEVATLLACDDTGIGIVGLPRESTSRAYGLLTTIVNYQLKGFYKPCFCLHMMLVADVLILLYLNSFIYSHSFIKSKTISILSLFFVSFNKKLSPFCIRPYLVINSFSIEKLLIEFNFHPSLVALSLTFSLT